MSNITTTLKVKSGFTFIKLDKDKKEIYRSSETKNVMTDYCYTRLTQNSSDITLPNQTVSKGIFRYLRLGKGTDELTVESTTITTPSASVDGNASGLNNTSTLVTINGVVYRKHVCFYSFAYAQFNNETFTQLGIFETTGLSTLLCGQRIKDNVGSPTSVTVLATEQLIVQYTIYLQCILTNDTLGSFVFNDDGVDYTATLICHTTPIFSNHIGTNSYLVNMPSSYTSTLGQGTSTVTYTGFNNRAEYSISIAVALLEKTSGISYLNIYRNYITNDVCQRLSFSPTLPKTDRDIAAISFKWIIKWRDL